MKYSTSYCTIAFRFENEKVAIRDVLPGVLSPKAVSYKRFASSFIFCLDLQLTSIESRTFGSPHFSGSVTLMNFSRIFCCKYSEKLGGNSSLTTSKWVPTMMTGLLGALKEKTKESCTISVNIEFQFQFKMIYLDSHYQTHKVFIFYKSGESTFYIKLVDM